MKAKLITLLILSAIVFGAKAQAQVIQNFESGLPAGIAALSDATENGLTDHPECYSVDANPASNAVNPSANCFKMTHKGYTHWGSKNNFGIEIPLTTAIPVDKSSATHYLTFKYYANTMGTKVAILLYDASHNTNYLFSVPDVTLTSTWVDVSIDINVTGCNVSSLSSVYIIPDYGYATNNRTSDVIVYIDDLKIAPAIAFSGDFETGLSTGIVALSDADGLTDHPECYTIASNPASNAVNSSATCLKLTHKGYTKWGSKNNFGIDVPVSPAIVVDKLSTSHSLNFKYFATTIGDNVSILLSDNSGTYTEYRFDVPAVTTISQWVEVSFDLNTSGCNVANITSIYFIPDFGYATNSRSSDVIVYIDDVRITNSPTIAVSVLSDASISSFSATNSPDVIVSNSELTIDQDANVNSIILNPGAKLTLVSGKTLTVGMLTLHSDATGTATFVDNGGTVSATSVSVEQYLNTGRNSYISSPLSNATSNVFSASLGHPLYWYDEAHGTAAPWPTITDAETSLKVMQGYITNPSASGVVTFSGSLNTGAKSMTLYRTAGQNKEGFNLVGNPYPSYLNWDNVTKTNLLTTLWYRTKTAPAPITGATDYVFDTYNATGGVGTSLGAKAVTNLIPPMQAFWVRVNQGQTSGTLSVNNNQRAHGDNVSNTFKAKSNTANAQPLLRLEVTNGLSSDQTIVYFNTDALNGYDSYDSPKMSNNLASVPEIYTLAGSEHVVINGVSDMTQLALGFTTGETNNFTIKASQFSNFAPGTQLIICDNLLNEKQDLTLGDYSFHSDITANNENRFRLLFKAPSETTGINPNSNNNIWISFSNKHIVVNGVIGETTVAVYNEIGQKIVSQRLTETDRELDNLLTSGVYMIMINNIGKNITQKVIIK